MRSHNKVAGIARKKPIKPIRRHSGAIDLYGMEIGFICTRVRTNKRFFMIDIRSQISVHGPTFGQKMSNLYLPGTRTRRGPITEGGSMRQDHRILLPVMVASALTFAGCFSRTKEIDTVPAPAPVVQVNPPVVVPAPGTQTTTTTWNGAAVHNENVPVPPMPPPSATSQSTTTWGNGSVVQRNTVSEPQPGVVQKQTTTSWNNGAAAPSDETTTITTTTSP